MTIGRDIATAVDILEYDPNKKGKDWCLLMARNMYSMYKDAGMRGFLGQKNDWIENRRYARGVQDITKYKKMLDRNDQTEQYDYMDFSNLEILPKYCDIQTGILNKVGMEITCNAIDPVSMGEKEKEKFTAEAQVVLKNYLKSIEQDSGYKLTSEDEAAVNLFTSLESVRLYFDTEFKLGLEIAMEVIIDGTYHVINDIDEIKQQLERDLRECGMAGVKHYCQTNGLIKLRRVDPVNLITSFTKDCSFSDVRQFGELLFINILTLKMLAGNQFTEEEYKDIANQFSGKYGNPTMALGQDASYYTQPLGGFIYDKFTVLVLDCEFLSTDKIKVAKSKNRYGNEVIKKKTASYEPPKGKEVKDVCYDRWYKCSWIIGSEKYCYNYGVVEFPNVPEHQLNMPKSSYSIQAIELNDMVTAPIISRAKSIVDQIQLTWLQLQNFLAKAIPPGVAINIMSLLDVPDGKGGKMLPLDIIERFVKTGNLLIAGILPDGTRDSRLPVEMLMNGVSPQIAVFQGLLSSHIGMLQQVLGLNEYTDASTPSPESAVGIAKLSAQGTFNSLYPMIHALSQILKRTAEGVVNRAQHLAGNGDLDYMVNAIGVGALAMLKTTKDLSAPVFGITMDVDTDTERRMRLDAKVQQALAQRQQNGVGGIELEDALAIESFRNIKLSERMLIERRKRRQMEDEQRSQRLQEANSKVQQDSLMTAEQAKQQTMVLDMQMYERKKMIDLAYKEKELQLQSKYKKEEIIVKAEAETQKELITQETENSQQ